MGASDQELLEAIAALEHEQWAHWTRYMLEKLEPFLAQPDRRPVSVRSGDLVIYSDEICDAGTCCRPPGHAPPHGQFDGPVYRDEVHCHPADDVAPRAAIETPYAELSEAEKDSDRVWASLVLAKVREATQVR